MHSGVRRQGRCWIGGVVGKKKDSEPSFLIGLYIGGGWHTHSMLCGAPLRSLRAVCTCTHLWVCQAGGGCVCGGLSPTVAQLWAARVKMSPPS